MERSYGWKGQIQEEQLDTSCNSQGFSMHHSAVWEQIFQTLDISKFDNSKNIYTKSTLINLELTSWCYLPFCIIHFNKTKSK